MTALVQTFRFLPKWVVLIFVALLALVAGCSRSPVVEYYVLSPAGENRNRSGIENIGENIIAVTTPSLPSYLDKDEIVERLPNNAVQIHEHQRWATDLDDMIRDFLIASLQGRVQGVSFVSSNAKFAREADVRWEGVFTKFDIHQGQAIDLKLSWHLLGVRNRSFKVSNQISVFESLQDNSVETLVDTLNEMLAKVADEIANGLSVIDRSVNE